MKKTVLTAAFGIMILATTACGEHRRDTAPEPVGDTVTVEIEGLNPDTPASGVEITE